MLSIDWPLRIQSSSIDTILLCSLEKGSSCFQTSSNQTTQQQMVSRRQVSYLGCTLSLLPRRYSAISGIQTLLASFSTLQCIHLTYQDTPSHFLSAVVYTTTINFLLGVPTSTLSNLVNQTQLSWAKTHTSCFSVAIYLVNYTVIISWHSLILSI